MPTGRSFCSGSHLHAAGTNFAVWAPGASRVLVCLFGDDGETRLALHGPELDVWHGHVAGVGPGQRYGFRVDGPWRPERGWLPHPDKLLLDPYARAIEGEVEQHEFLPVVTYAGGRNGGDTAPYVPRSVVVTDEPFDWGDDSWPRTPWDRTVIYEAHVRGMTMRHPDVPQHLRGSYAGLGYPAVTGYLTDLGVTAIELLPVQHFVSERAHVQRGLVNYWGYNPIGFFAPHAAYSSTGTRSEQVTEFKQLVKALHAAGLEVILDVVYNHTAEGGRTGPALSFRGLDDGAYYAGADPIEVTMPDGCAAESYLAVLRTDGATDVVARQPGSRVLLAGRTLAVFEAL